MSATRLSRRRCTRTTRSSKLCASSKSEGGWPARHARYAALAEQARAGLEACGIASVLPANESSVVLRAYRLPRKLSYVQLHDGLKARGFVIYAGQGALSAELFRISTMGNIHAADVERLLQGFNQLLR